MMSLCPSSSVFAENWKLDLKPEEYFWQEDFIGHPQNFSISFVPVTSQDNMFYHLKPSALTVGQFVVSCHYCHLALKLLSISVM